MPAPHRQLLWTQNPASLQPRSTDFTPEATADSEAHHKDPARVIFVLEPEATKESEQVYEPATVSTTEGI